MHPPIRVITMSKTILSQEIGSGHADVLTSSGAINARGRTNIEVRFTGGIATDVESIDLAIKPLYRKEDSYRSVGLTTCSIFEGDSRGTGRRETHTSTITVPPETPGTIGRISVLGTFEFSTTNKCIEVETYLGITPTPHLYATFYSMFDLGFGVRDIDCVSSGLYDDLPYAIKLVYEPTAEPFTKSLDTVTLLCRQTEDDLKVFVVFDEETSDEPVSERGFETRVSSAQRRDAGDRIREIIERETH